ncbi:Uncharacterised protein [Escherichia coli]|nr:Uncharacterised protein [Escherichia coli]
MLLQGGVIFCRDSGLFCFFPGFRFEFSQEVVHRSHAEMRIAVPHKHHPGFLNTGHGDKRTMIVSVSLIDFR